MPYLGDYLGHLLSEVTRARLQADLESLRVAEIYASNDLMQHFAVPRFRLPRLTIDAPVAVQGLEDGATGQPPEPPLDRFHKRLDEHLERSGIGLANAEKTALRRTVDDTAAKGSKLSGVELVDELVSAVVAFLGALKRKAGPIEPERLERFGAELRMAVRADFAVVSPEPPRLKVAVSSAELREVPPGAIARLQLTITEEAMEWRLIESQGETREKLVPE